MMTDVNQQAGQVLSLARAGDVAGAIAAGEAVLSTGRSDAGLAMFIGVLCCRQGDMARGVVHLRQAVTLAPGEMTAKVELARALLATGINDEAEKVAAPLASATSPLGREMQRIQAHALLRQVRTADGTTLFEQLTVADANDFESWDGLGAGRLALGDIDGAIAALRRATQLRPTAIAYWSNLARAYGAKRDFEAAVAAARRATAQAPRDAVAQLELARALAGLDRFPEALDCLAEAQAAATDNADLISEIADVEFACKAFERSEANYRTVLALRPLLEKAWLGLGTLLERLNRTEELLDLLDAAEIAGVAMQRTALLRARALRNQNRLEEALAMALQAREDVEAAPRAQLIGDIADRLGDVDTAFAAFSQANQLLAAGAVGSSEQAYAYREKFRLLHDLLTPEWVARWTPPTAPDTRPPPLFVFGFPRSGTTLIDTMLSGHPDAVVLEEEATIDLVAKRNGPIERVATLSARDIEQLRAHYFAKVDALTGGIGDRMIVDKNPLGLGNAALLNRLFPDARFVFAERHPCDVVLSCFITSAQMDAKVGSFYDFLGTAQLYDRVLAYWRRCVSTLPMRVHNVRYERLIVDAEKELRSLADFAGLSWDPQLLANQSNASARPYIGSPSYAQVAEPIYTRARGRWLRYREHMAVAMPILAPWVEKLGYDL